MFPLYPSSDTVHVPSLKYGSQNPQASSCVMAGLIIVIVYLMLMERPRMGPHRATAGSAVATMFSKVSARIASVVASPAMDASEVYEEIPPKTVHLIDCKSVKKLGKDGWKSYTDAEKEQCHKDAIAWLRSHEKAVVMIFAPWCGHCHTQIKMMGALAAEITTYPIVLINAEAVPRMAISGPNAIYNVQHFPTFLAKSGNMIKPTGSLKEAHDELKALDEAVPQAVSDEPAPEAEEEDEEAKDAFVGLF